MGTSGGSISNCLVKGSFPEVRCDELEPKKIENKDDSNAREEEVNENFKNYVVYDMSVRT